MTAVTQQNTVAALADAVILRPGQQHKEMDDREDKGKNSLDVIWNVVLGDCPLPWELHRSCKKRGSIYEYLWNKQEVPLNIRGSIPLLNILQKHTQTFNPYLHFREPPCCAFQLITTAH